jgi:signal peptidase II
MALHLLRLLLAGIFVLGADQLTKRFVAGHLAGGKSASAGRWIKIHHVDNGNRTVPRTTLGLLLLWVGVVGCLILILRQGYFFRSLAAQLSLGAALGGAASNLYDRLRRGAVIDFLDLGVWPVFNLADVAITAGAVAALWLVR